MSGHPFGVEGAGVLVIVAIARRADCFYNYGLCGEQSTPATFCLKNHDRNLHRPMEGSSRLVLGILLFHFRNLRVMGNKVNLSGDIERSALHYFYFIAHSDHRHFLINRRYVNLSGSFTVETSTIFILKLSRLCLAILIKTVPRIPVQK